MDSRQIIGALKDLRIPHDRIADVIGRDRSAASKMLAGRRSVKVNEVEPLLALIAEWRGRGIIHLQQPPVQKPEPRLEPLYLPVRHRVQAGNWLEVDLASQDFPAPPQAVAPNPRYGSWPQWLELVEGDSVDKEIRAGSYAHVVDAVEMGYLPQDGDFVVVERVRDHGRLRERSIKQVVVGAGGRIEFWPRSNNPDWNRPLDLTHQEEGVEARIVGLVIGSYRGLR